MGERPALPGWSLEVSASKFAAGGRSWRDPAKAAPVSAWPE
jgi:hypothetical protein